MRHGWEYWETFFKWLKNEAKPVWILEEGKINVGSHLDTWIKYKQDEFWRLWKSGSVVPPKDD